MSYNYKDILNSIRKRAVEFNRNLSSKGINIIEWPDEYQNEIEDYFSDLFELAMEFRLNISINSVPVIMFMLNVLSSPQNDNKYKITPEEIFDILQTLPEDLKNSICKKAKKYSKLQRDISNKRSFCEILDEDDGIADIATICYYIKSQKQLLILMDKDDIEDTELFENLKDFHNNVYSYDSQIASIETKFCQDMVELGESGSFENKIYYCTVFLWGLIHLKEMRLLNHEESIVLESLFECSCMRDYYDYIVFLNNEVLRQQTMDLPLPLKLKRFAYHDGTYNDPASIQELRKKEIKKANGAGNTHSIECETTKENKNEDRSIVSCQLGKYFPANKQLRTEWLENLYYLIPQKLKSIEPLESTTIEDFIYHLSSEQKADCKTHKGIYWHGADNNTSKQTLIEISWFIKNMLPLKGNNFWENVGKVFWYKGDDGTWLHPSGATLNSISRSQYAKIKETCNYLEKQLERWKKGKEALSQILPNTNWRERGKKRGG